MSREVLFWGMWDKLCVHYPRLQLFSFVKINLSSNCLIFLRVIYLGSIIYIHPKKPLRMCLRLVNVWRLHEIVIPSGQFDYGECVHLSSVASGSFLLSRFPAEIYKEGAAISDPVIAGVNCAWWPVHPSYRELLRDFEIVIIAFCSCWHFRINLCLV